MLPDARARLDAAIARKNAERGRPLTAREKLNNLEAGLGYAPGTAPWWPRNAQTFQQTTRESPLPNKRGDSNHG